MADKPTEVETVWSGDANDDDSDDARTVVTPIDDVSAVCEPDD